MFTALMPREKVTDSMRTKLSSILTRKPSAATFIGTMRFTAFRAVGGIQRISMTATALHLRRSLA
jgi:hypothetical protein